MTIGPHKVRAALLLVVLCFLACDAGRSRSGENATEKTTEAGSVAGKSAPILVTKEWQVRRLIVAAAAEGREFKSYEFEIACEFFLNLTGINISRTEDDAMHWKSTAETGKALPLLDKWLAQNYKRLYWDRESNGVKMCILNASRGGQAAGIYGVKPIWAAHESVFMDIEKGIQGPVGEFQDAVEFFSDLTGIAIRGEGNYVGFFPTPESVEDFKAIRTWYERNKDNLCWDKESGTIEFCSDGSSAMDGPQPSGGSLPRGLRASTPRRAETQTRRRQSW